MTDQPTASQRELRQQRIRLAVRWHDEGQTNSDIAHRLAVSPSAVCKYLRAGGVPPGRNGGRYPARASFVTSDELQAVRAVAEEARADARRALELARGAA